MSGRLFKLNFYCQGLIFLCIFVMISVNHEDCRGIFPMYTPIMLHEAARQGSQTSSRRADHDLCISTQDTFILERRTQIQLLSLDYLILGILSYHCVLLYLIIFYSSSRDESLNIYSEKDINQPKYQMIFQQY